jgi:hypothetical protein
MGKVTVWRQLNLGDGTVADVAQVEQPHRAPSLESDVYVPFLQAVGSAIVIGSAAAVAITLLWHVSLWPLWPASIAICGGLAWLWRLAEVGATLWHTESMVIEAQPTPPKQAQPRLLLANPTECAATAATAEREQHQAASRDELVTFVRRCAVKGCGESAHGITPATRGTYLGNRDLLFSLGLARWRSANHKAGWELSAPPADCVVLLKRHVIGR